MKKTILLKTASIILIVSIILTLTPTMNVFAGGASGVWLEVTYFVPAPNGGQKVEAMGYGYGGSSRGMFTPDGNTLPPLDAEFTFKMPSGKQVTYTVDNADGISSSDAAASYKSKLTGESVPCITWSFSMEVKPEDLMSVGTIELVSYPLIDGYDVDIDRTYSITQSEIDSFTASKNDSDTNGKGYFEKSMSFYLYSSNSLSDAPQQTALVQNAQHESKYTLTLSGVTIDFSDSLDRYGVLLDDRYDFFVPTGTTIRFSHDTEIQTSVGKEMIKAGDVLVIDNYLTVNLTNNNVQFRVLEANNLEDEIKEANELGGGYWEFRPVSELISDSAQLPAAAEIPSLPPKTGVSNDINVLLNGEYLNFDVSPQIIDGRTLVPLRVIFEALGATVDWNSDTSTVIGDKGDISISMQIGNTTIYRNGTPITLDVPPQIIDGRTLVPVRAVAESFGVSVDWDGDNNTVILMN